MNRLAAEELLRRRARSNLLDFMRWCWLLPGEFKIGRHTRAFCSWFDRALERWERGESSYLLFNCPPRHGKSEMCNYANAYFLGRTFAQQTSAIYTGYGAKLVAKFSKNIKAIIQSEAYRALFPEVQLSATSNAVDAWQLAGSAGEITCTGLGGSLTGKGGHLITLDDYCKSSEEAMSEVYRDKTWESFATDLFTRQMAPACIVIVTATPWHMDDVTCRIQRKMREDADFPQFERLCYPARCEEWDALFPELFKSAWYDNQRTMNGPAKWSALFLCNPIGDGMRLFMDEWFQQYSTVPTGTANFIFVDTAGSAKKHHNDYLVMWVIGIGRDENIYVLDGIRDRLNLSERTELFLRLAKKWKPLNTWWEQVGAQTDLEHVSLEMDRQGWRTPIAPLGQRVVKEGRISWLQPLFEQGRIWLPNKLFYQQRDGRMVDLVNLFLEEEYRLFPSVEHDDMLDCLANVRHPDVLPRLERLRSPYSRDPGRGENYREDKWKRLMG